MTSCIILKHYEPLTMTAPFMTTNDSLDHCKWRLVVAAARSVTVWFRSFADKSDDMKWEDNLAQPDPN